MLARPVDKRDHANGVWWITVQFGENPSYAGRCAVGDTRSGCWRSEHRQRSGATRKYLHTPFHMQTTLTLHSNALGSERTSQLMPGQHGEWHVCFAVREVLLAETSQRYIASVLARLSHPLD